MVAIKSNPLIREIYLKHTEKGMEKMDRNRRYQGFDAQAPISRRQAQKKKERKLSQSDNNAKSGIKNAPVPSLLT